MSKFSKITSLALGGIVLATTACFAATGIVNAPNGLILREEASRNGEIITTISDDSSVEIIEEDGEWYRVKYNDEEGYVFAEYVDVEDETTEQEETTTESNEEENSNNENEQTNQEEAVTEESTNAEEKAYPQNKTVNTNLNIYIIPSVTSKIIGTAEKDATITVNYELNGWINVRLGDITGWARKYFVDMDSNVEVSTEEEQTENEKESTSNEDNTTQVENTTGYVSASTSANVRAKATTDSSIVTILTRNTAVTITGEEGDFYKIQYRDYEGYISKDLISDSPVTTTSRSGIDRTEKSNHTDNKEEQKETQNVVSSNNTEGDKIVSFAKKYIGYDYTWGGTSPSKGFDCSGFVYYVYNSCGYSLSRSCQVQATSGTAVSKSNLAKGDLVFFDNGSNGSIGHVGIYIGGGKIIHAENERTGVRTDTINSGYYNKYYYSARRIIK